MNRIIFQVLIELHIQLSKLTIISALLASIIIFTGCEEKLEYVVKYYPDGSIFAVGNLRGDKPEGVWVFFERDGTILGHGGFVNGEKNGKWYVYGIDCTMKEYNLSEGYADGIIVYTQHGDTLDVEKCRMGKSEYIVYYLSDGTKLLRNSSIPDCDCRDLHELNIFN